jgi:hypothetical protein
MSILYSSHAIIPHTTYPRMYPTMDITAKDVMYRFRASYHWDGSGN